MNKVNLEKSVNHHIAISAIMIKRVFFKILNDNKLDITPEQWNILYHLNESDGMTIGKLSEITYKDFANMSRMTQKLETAGFVEKKREDIDKRVFKLFITKKGKKLNDQLHQCAFESTNIALEGLEEEAREIMIKNLKHVITNTQKFLK
ncbi:MarR family winged helix-turn-helix transcriptional regulator [Ancylomarina longa]|uniref:MarR family transcriptional regulator n=1 Tax=Ancylomarina longa TaxID=2487017 RepID=A0A434AV59_9BACT|nr:MarR family transcriptional regulator [Ancylomarina longa]RUT78339.1 MarR family transcriptional regulator [Ancylomarina longa]